MDLKQAVMKNDAYLAENILKKKLQQNPKNIQLWLKLSLTELWSPFEDYISALSCIDKIYQIEENNLDALILETSIKWHSFGFIEDELFERLEKVRCDEKNKKAIIYYLQSLYYYNDDIVHQKVYLRKSISLCDEFVYPYKALGRLLMLESNISEAGKMFKKAIENVKKVYIVDDFYDFTDLNTYIAEYITGTHITQENYNFIKELAADKK